jgi:hypothetical protein
MICGMNYIFLLRTHVTCLTDCELNMATVVVNNRSAVVLRYKNISGILAYLKVIELLIMSL